MTRADLYTLPLRIVRPAHVIRCGDPSKRPTEPIVFRFDRDAFLAAYRDWSRK